MKKIDLKLDKNKIIRLFLFTLVLIFTYILVSIITLYVLKPSNNFVSRSFANTLPWPALNLNDSTVTFAEFFDTQSQLSAANQPSSRQDTINFSKNYLIAKSWQINNDIKVPASSQESLLDEYNHLVALIIQDILSERDGSAQAQTERQDANGAPSMLAPIMSPGPGQGQDDTLEEGATPERSSINTEYEAWLTEKLSHSNIKVFVRN